MGRDCSPKITVVDMPGYGFGSETEWGSEIVTYMKNRKELRRAFVVIDSYKESRSTIENTRRFAQHDYSISIDSQQVR